MKKLSETYKELGIAFSFPIKIKDDDGNVIYWEDSDGFLERWEYNANGNETYYENSDGYWIRREFDSGGNRTYWEDSKGYYVKREHDADGNETYYENSNGHKEGTPRSAKTCEGKVVEVDGIKYKLKAL